MIGAFTLDPATALRNLIFEYSLCIDRADWQGVADLFREATYVVARSGESFDGPGIAEHLRRTIQVHEDGTPLTTHVNNNVILAIDDRRGVARAHTPVIVWQHISGQADVVYIGHYDDEFVRAGDEWRWSKRVANARFTGDLSRHQRRVSTDV